jgi:hypothetical protein
MRFAKHYEFMSSTTHVDSQNEAVTKSDLDSMVQASEDHSVWLTFRHDPAIPPIGRIIEQKVVELDDGYFGVKTKTGIFELDSYRSLNEPVGFELSILKDSDFKEDKTDVEVLYNPHVVDTSSFDGINSIDGISINHRHAVEKSFDAEWWLQLILAPLFDSFIKVAIKEWTGKTTEEAAKIFISSIKNILSNLRGRTVISYMENQNSSSRSQRHYVIFEFKISDTSCQALVFLTGSTSNEVNSQIQAAEERLDRFIAISNTLVQQNLSLDTIKMAYFPPENDWKILFGTDKKTGEVFLGDLGRSGLEKIFPQLP